jgi:cytochrome c553
LSYPSGSSRWAAIQLRGFKARTASDLDGTMTMAAQPLTAEDVENLAHYLASLDPAAR